MSYLWRVLVEATDKNIDKNSIVFKPAQIYSPYMEVALENLNSPLLSEGREIEVNYWYRFHDIFRDLFPVDYVDNKELREVFFDIVMHYLGELDLQRGLSKKYFYRDLIYKDIKNGELGENIRNNIDMLDKYELEYFLDGIINQYDCGSSIQNFEYVLRAIYKNNIVYKSKNKVKDIYIYLDTPYSEAEKKKIDMIIDTFLPINTRTFIFWDKHFGIMGVESTMKQGSIALI